MHILIVDDEALARSRLRTLLGDCEEREGRQGREPLLVQEAADASQALEVLQAAQQMSRPVQLVLLDIHMPGRDGLALAHALRALPHPVAIVFVTAHAHHAVDAFELDAADYLTKPVRLERLEQALLKAARAIEAQGTQAAREAGAQLLIQERGRTLRLPLAEVLYLKAEQKYITVRTAARHYILDGALAELEELHGEHLLRVHRNALVARSALRGLERCDDGADGESWMLQLHGVPEMLAVSRRQLTAVRAVLRQPPE
ncbi:DNA-binding response regulator [Comamonas phosphati]|nr:DNA-binding response regulator [Comamonas phosphati]